MILEIGIVVCSCSLLAQSTTQKNVRLLEVVIPMHVDCAVTNQQDLDAGHDYAMRLSFMLRFDWTKHPSITSK